MIEPSVTGRGPDNELQSGSYLAPCQPEQIMIKKR